MNFNERIAKKHNELHPEDKPIKPEDVTPEFIKWYREEHVYPDTRYSDPDDVLDDRTRSVLDELERQMDEDLFKMLNQ